MATITTRAGKGTPLTNTEVDDNFTNLNTDKAELSGAAFTGNVSTTASLGVGTPSPSEKLHVSDSSDFLVDVSASDSAVVFKESGGNSWRIGNDSSTDAFVVSQSESSLGTDVKLFINSSGNVGIGTTGPSYPLDVDGLIASQDAYLITANSSGTPSAGAFMFRPASNTLALGTNSTERMRIDSAGNLLVGTTESNVDNNTSGKGIVLAEGGYVQIAREATAQTQGMLHLNATGVDANMIEFKKDAVAAGFIGTKDGDIYLGTGDTGLRFYDDGNEVYPAQASDGAGRDAAVDLGSTSKRFKDLRLSGTAYVGSVLIGTTAATPNAKLKVNGAAILNDSVIYSKAYSTLDTTGHVVAKATGGTNGNSTTFIFTGQGGGAAPFHIVFSCINAGGQWSATRSEIAASSSVDVVASTSGNDVLFTFKSKSGTQLYSPRVRIETIGNFYDTAYLAA